MKNLARIILAILFLSGASPKSLGEEVLVEFVLVRTTQQNAEISKEAKISVCAEDLDKKNGICKILVTASGSSLANCDVTLKFKDVIIAKTTKAIPLIASAGSVMVTLNIPKEKLIEYNQFDSILHVGAVVTYVKK